MLMPLIHHGCHKLKHITVATSSNRRNIQHDKIASAVDRLTTRDQVELDYGFEVAVAVAVTVFICCC